MVGEKAGTKPSHERYPKLSVAGGPTRTKLKSDEFTWWRGQSLWETKADEALEVSVTGTKRVGGDKSPGWDPKLVPKVTRVGGDKSPKLDRKVVLKVTGVVRKSPPNWTESGCLR